jgi:predicted O-methyltransferase YrrM
MASRSPALTRKGQLVAKFNVTVVTREGFLHTKGFHEVMDSVSWSLSSLGHDVSVTSNWFSESGETNIIFGAELIDISAIPSNSIVYNLEQPSHPNMSQVRRLVKESGCTVWDYSQRAVEEWRAAGQEKVFHVPIGYTPNLTRIPRSSTQDTDVAFFGWMTPRRTALLEELKKAGLKVYASSACYGGGRDNIVSRSKVCLNLHHDGRDRFEVVRCSYYMANSCCIVTEVSSDDDEYQDLRGLSLAPYRLLLDTLISFTQDSADRERILMGERALESIRLRDYAVTIAAALDGTATPVTPSRPLEHAILRDSRKKEYLAEARQLSKVQIRYQAALQSGDMKDFMLWLRDHAKGNIMEIGVRDGASTSAFLSGLEEYGGHLYSVDVQPCGHLFSGHPQWTFIQANSTDVDTVIKKMPFELDLLLIDGDHSRAGVLSDITYARNLRPGGMILFHDIAPEPKPSDCSDPTWPSDDVKNVYEELCVSMAPLGWTHFTLPGRYGMGVLVKPAPALVEVSK